MSLRSALQDLSENTLQAVTGCFRRLEYVARLKRQDGGYGHWGLAHVHGDSPAQKALSEAHRSILSQVLSTPLQTLLDDVEHASLQAEISPTAYVERLSSHDENLLPPAPGAGAARHLNSVLLALSGLTKNRKPAAIRRAS